MRTQDAAAGGAGRSEREGEGREGGCVVGGRRLCTCAEDNGSDPQVTGDPAWRGPVPGGDSGSINRSCCCSHHGRPAARRQRSLQQGPHAASPPHVVTCHL